MTYTESQDASCRGGKSEQCTLGGYEGSSRQGGQGRQALSLKVTQEGMELKKNEAQSVTEEHIAGNNSLQDVLPGEDLGQDGRHTAKVSTWEAEREERRVHRSQREGEGVATAVLPQQGAAKEQPFPAKGVVSVSAKRSGSKAESTHGRHDAPAYTSQVAVAFLMAWVLMSACTGLVFPGVALPQFTNPNTDDLYLEPETLALFASIVHLGTMMGSLVTGQLLAPLGARVNILIGLPLGMAAWLGLTFSSQLWVLMTCRFLQGCTFAMVKPPSVMYMVEVAHESIRGRMVGVLGIAKETGFLSSYILGGLRLTWRQLSLLYACIMVPSVIGVFFLPSSPRWLTTRGRVDEARKSLVFFRGRHCDVEPELLKAVRQAEDAGTNNSTWQQLSLLARPATLRMFLLVLTYFVFYPLSGTAMISAYLMVMLDTPGTPLESSLGSTVCSIFKISGTVLQLIAIDHFGRVSILVVLLCLTSVCTSAYGYSLYFLESRDALGIGWLPLISLIILQFLAGNIAPIIDVLQGELLSNACRAVSMPILSLLNGLFVFGAVKLFPQLKEVIGLSGLFASFTVVAMALALLSVMAMPETRGLSLETISDAIHYNTTKQRVVKPADDVSVPSTDAQSTSVGPSMSSRC